MAQDRMIRTWRLGLLFGCMLILAAGCKDRQPLIAIDAAEAKLSPTLLGVVSVFLKIDNSGNAGDVLLGARTAIPGAIVELHDIEDGKMITVDRIAVPADSQVVLRPARQHIMIYKLPKDVKEGSPLDLVLVFQRSGEKTVHCLVTPFSSSRNRLRN